MFFGPFLGPSTEDTREEVELIDHAEGSDGMIAPELMSAVD